MGKFVLGLEQLVGLEQGTNHPSGTSPPSQSSVPSGKCFQSRRRLLLTGYVTIAIPCRTRSFFRNIQSTPWSTKSGLAGKDIADLRVTELTRKGLDDFSFRCVSKGEFQSIVFVRSISEAVFVSNLLRHIRQDRIDLDAVAANMHGPAPPDKHKESARFMQPLLGEVVSTIKSTPLHLWRRAPRALKVQSWQKPRGSCRKLALLLTPEKKPRAAQNSPSSTGPSLPTKGTKTPAEEILEKELTTPPSTVPGSTSNEAVEKWLKKHQSQFRGKASAFKKHVADVVSVFQASEATKQDLAETAVKYGLQKKHADRMSFHILSTFICACQFQAA